MTYARKLLISLSDTPYYHVVARCVRRAWLWGFDDYAGRDYSHRKAWVLERMKQLAAVFAIDVCAYAVMSNHYHLVLRVAHQSSRAWSDAEVIERWTQLFSRPPLIERWQQGLCGDTEQDIAARLIEQWRHRLSDVSWYMRCLNEHLARRANREDGCTGRFWEGRFKSQALLDEAGLLTAMVYVDLNPIRAGIASVPEDSEFTSIQARVQQIREMERGRPPPHAAARSVPTGVPLLAFSDEGSASTVCIPFALHAYIDLVDWSGRVLRTDKRGAIEERLPALVQRLNIDSLAWQRVMQPGSNTFGRALGRLDRLRLHAKTLGQFWVRGLQHAQQLYRTG